MLMNALISLLQAYEMEIALAIVGVILFLALALDNHSHHEKRRTVGEEKSFLDLDPTDPRMMEIMDHISKCIFLNLLASETIQSLLDAAEESENRYPWDDE